MEKDVKDNLFTDQTKCPYCNSTFLVLINMEDEDTDYLVQCLGCNKKWREWHLGSESYSELIHVEEVSE